MKKRDNKNNNELIKIFIRYIILILIILLMPFIYKILTPLTIYPVYFTLDTIYNNVSLENNLITINSLTKIEIVPACVAGGAYLLLLILILSIKMSHIRRIKFIASSLLMLLIINILRIILFSILYHQSTPYIDFTHKLFWYIISTILVIAIWFFNVKLFKIKEIPFYTDFKTIINYIKKTK